MSKRRKDERPGQQRSSHRNPLVERRSKVHEFLCRANDAANAIREESHGRHSPSEVSTDKLEQAYEALRDYVEPVPSKTYPTPSGPPFHSFPVLAESPLQAWMILLNQEASTIGGADFLESDEYQAVQKEASKLLNHIMNPPPELILTRTQLDLFNATDEHPQITEDIAAKAGRSWEAARKYLPRLRKWGLVCKARPSGYYRRGDTP
ncbi:MAG: hypothetical protein KDA86_16490 [Planctomycetaceae bacterium]|nr:hypothetical protein [Planctomycetaceae bacterium]